MISPPGWDGVVFGDADDGDGRLPGEVRHRLSTDWGIDIEWATITQVHGTTVVRASDPGSLGAADAIYTTVPGLPLAVATADCAPVVVLGDIGVGIAHAGWRGAAAGVVPRLLEAMRAAGITPQRAAVGPTIGPCCFEIGPEVAAAFPDAGAVTTWGTPSVDLTAALTADLSGLDVWTADTCTRCRPGFNSHRRDHTPQRQVAVAWHSA